MVSTVVLSFTGVGDGPSGRLGNVSTLCQSLAEREVLAGPLDKLNHHVVRRDPYGGDDASVQLFEQREARFFRPASDEGHFEEDEVVGIFHSHERGRVKKTLARYLVDDLEKVVRRYPEHGDQRLLHGPGQRRKPLLVVAGFEDVNLGEGHLRFLWMIGALTRVATIRSGQPFRNRERSSCVLRIGPGTGKERHGPNQGR